MSARRRPSSRLLGRVRRRSRRWTTAGALLAALVVTAAFPVAAPGPAHADEGTAVAKRSSRRAGWATMLGVYAGIGGLATGAAYLTRDNFVGRAIAGTAGAWGGGSIGAGAAYALTLLAPCRTPSCEEERAVPVFLGALLGGVAGSLIASWKTSEPGSSRPTVTAVGMAPFFVFATLGTIFDW